MRGDESERPVGEPQIQVEAERRPSEALEDVHVERDDRAVFDLQPRPTDA